MSLIYHIANESDWEDATREGEYRHSTRGRTLEQQGFIHASQPSQVEPVANAFYSGAGRLVVLVIDEDRVRPEIHYERVPGWDLPFPHIYGPLNTDAVVETIPLAPGPDGRFSFNAGGDPRTSSRA